MGFTWLEAVSVVSDSNYYEPVNPTPAYNPQVEAISPTLPSENVAEDANFRSTKDDLLQKISKVDREISKVETMIMKLKKKEQELEEAACQPNEKKDEEEDRLAQQPKHQSLAQKIYAENRERERRCHVDVAWRYRVQQIC
ncbi:Gei-8p [Homalodisca vitripennis]|nr:Gei-8p [Homalodisca vitripennis]